LKYLNLKKYLELKLNKILRQSLEKTSLKGKAIKNKYTVNKNKII